MENYNAWMAKKPPDVDENEWAARYWTEGKGVAGAGPEQWERVSPEQWEKATGTETPPSPFAGSPREIDAQSVQLTPEEIRKFSEPPSVPVAGAPSIGQQPPAGVPGAGPGVRMGITGAPTGGLARIGRQMAGVAERQKERVGRLTAPYQVPRQAGEIPGMPGVSKALDIAALNEEFGKLAGKSERSFAETSRMRDIAEQLSSATQQEKQAKLTEQKEIGAQKQREQYIEQGHQATLRRLKLREETTKLEESIEDVKSWKMEPNRLWKENWGAAFAAIFLGAIGQTMQQRGGIQGAQNMGLQGVLDAQERDIEAQKADYAKRKGLVAERRGAYAMMMDKFKNEEIAEAAARVAMTESLNQQLDFIETKYKGTELADQARTNRALLADQQAQNRLNFEMKVDANITASLQARGGIEYQRAQLGLSAQQMAERRQMMAAKAAGAAPSPMLGFEAFRPVSKAESAEARKISDGMNETLSSIGKLISMRDKMGAEIWPSYVSKNKAKMKVVRSDLLMQFKNAYEMGALRPDEMEFLENLIPDVSSLGNVIPQLAVMRNILEERFERKMFNRGYRSQEFGPILRPAAAGGEVRFD